MTNPPLTRREYFAGLAMQALVAKYGVGKDHRNDVDFPGHDFPDQWDIAYAAVEQANRLEEALDESDDEADAPLIVHRDELAPHVAARYPLPWVVFPVDVADGVKCFATREEAESHASVAYYPGAEENQKIAP